MKPLLKAVLIILAVVLLSQCENDEPNPYVNIPDNNFLNALIEQGVDTNGDGEISSAEAEAVIYLYVSYSDISDLSGIEKFVNLDTLICNYNQLTTLDLSNNTALKRLECYGNRLTTLDLSNNTVLENLYLYDMPNI